VVDAADGVLCVCGGGLKFHFAREAESVWPSHPNFPHFGGRWKILEDQCSGESSIFRVNFFIQQIKNRESMTIETKRASTSQ
jgi:hypothetical protein